MSRGMRLAGVLGISVVAMLLAGATATSALLAPTAGAQQKEVASEGGTGSQLKEAQGQLTVATSRIRELEAQTDKQVGDRKEQQEATNDAQDRYEKRNKNSRGSIQFHRDAQRAMWETGRPLDKKRAEYEKLQEERRARLETLRRGEIRLKISASKLGSRPERMETRISELEAAEEAGAFTRPPASGGGESVAVEQEFEIAEDIVARPVEPIPYKRYVQVYKAAAKRYGFATDWYVLAAVGKVESNHGENMGPSSAGAMGPMQFLPSTWEQYGVDGNGDGEANIMDPEDAIPAAASYLEFGGAPDDWHAALYTYNHAGWYVREVLSIAESYRRQADDDRVKPYV